jgi:hypothetical protein
MRASEFITEQRNLPPESAEPMRYTYVLPGLSASDPYKNYRMGVAMARARSDYASALNPLNNGIDPYTPEWSAETPFGEHAVVAGMNLGIEPVIDAALKMTKTPGGKRMVSTGPSEEPAFVKTQSPIKPFKGYPR